MTGSLTASFSAAHTLSYKNHGRADSTPQTGKRRKYDNPRVIRGAPAREVHSLTPLTVKIDQFLRYRDLTAHLYAPRQIASIT